MSGDKLPRGFLRQRLRGTNGPAVDPSTFTTSTEALFQSLSLELWPVR